MLVSILFIVRYAGGLEAVRRNERPSHARVLRLCEASFSFAVSRAVSTTLPAHHNPITRCKAVHDNLPSRQACLERQG